MSNILNYKVLGVKIVEVQNGTDWTEINYSHKTYTVVLEYNNIFYKFVIRRDEGPCGSGYCGASWGEQNFDLIEIEEPITIIKPIKDIYLEVCNNKVRHSIQDPEEYSDSVTTIVKTTEGEKFSYDTGCGGCHYYPSGTAVLNLELFEI